MSTGNSNDCVFCGIINKKIKANVVLDAKRVIAFHDLNKVADLHLLIIPKLHFENLNEMKPEHAEILADILLVAKELAAQFGIDKSGYRLVMNTGADAGQTVFHLHMHLLGGRIFSWPPG